MSIEVATATEVEPDAPPPPAVDADADSETRPAEKKVKRAKRIEVDDAETRPSTPRESAVVREIRTDEERSLKSMLDELGPDGSFKIVISRMEPPDVWDPVTSRRLKSNGFVQTYEQKIDEEFIKERHGGGKYHLKFLKRGTDGKPGYPISAHRTVEIIGDPNLEELRGRVASGHSPIPAAAAPAESPQVVIKAMEAMERAADRAREAHVPADNTATVEAMKMMVETLKAQLASRDGELRDLRGSYDSQMRQLREELKAAREYRAPEDPIKQKILDSLIDGESGRIAGLRATHESELRTIKANAIEEERRLRDAAERERTELRTSHEREITLMKMSHETAMAATKSAFDTQVKLLEGQIKTLERDNSELRIEVKDLRAKKEKSLVEQAKDIKEVKEALGVDDGDGDDSAVGKILDVISNPEALKFAQGLIGKGKEATPDPKKADATGKKHKRQVVKAANGDTYILKEDGSLEGPVRKAPKQTPDGLPVIEPDKVKLAVAFLEKAFTGGQAPEAVATSCRTMVPEEILQAIRDHGIDTFMQKIAKLPSASPLGNQEGRNWVRKVAKILVG